MIFPWFNCQWTSLTLILTFQGCVLCLERQLLSYDVLNSLKIRTSRSNEGNPSGHEDEFIFIDFETHGKRFTVKAHPTRDLFSRDFRLYEHDGNGTVREHKVDFKRMHRHYLKGEVVGEPNSHAVLHYSGESLSGSIYLTDEVYTIEKALLNEIKSPLGRAFVASSHVVYKDSEISEINSGPGCALAKDRLRRFYSTEAEHVGREDFSPERKRCSLRLVADHTYFKTIGEGNLRKTIDKMVTQIQRVNVIFNETEFVDDDHNGYFNMGFLVRDVHVLKESTPVAGDNVHFNMQGDISAEDMLQSFAEEEADENQWVCLAHLFTARSLDDGALGRAYIGHISAERGICARLVKINSKSHKYAVQNVGLTTSTIMGKRLLSRVSDITVAHELAHGWGAEHDPDTPECLPPENSGGAYIMNAHSNSGRNSNNRVLSPCSIRQIMLVLKHKSTCFVEPTSGRCGNFIVEDDEECDVGPIKEDDLCCTRSCKLRKTASCSDLNHACCNQCQLETEGIMCKSRLPNECLDDSFCSGETERCPIQQPLPDNTTCSDRGTCRGGQCIPFCESIGQISCLCEGNQACYRCCRQSLSHACNPIEPPDRLSDGTMCKDGFCKAGRCKKKVQDVVSRIVGIIRKVSPSWIIGILRRYSVPLVILSLSIFWIPFAVFLHYYDKETYSFGSIPAARSSMMLSKGSSAALNSKRNSSYLSEHFSDL